MSNQSLLHYSFNTTTTDDDATVRVVSRIATARGAAAGRYDKVPCLKNTELHASMVARKLQY